MTSTLSGEKQITGHLEPSGASEQDIGSSVKPYRRLFVQELSLTQEAEGDTGAVTKAQMETAIAAASIDGAFVADEATDWSPEPILVGPAIDQLAARTTVVEAAVVFKQDAATVPAALFTATTAGDWDGTAPVTIQDAIDRLAALVAVLNSGTGA